ncbi:MAG: diaminopimelate decarboxylase [Nitrospirota bacterium]|nr:diaminopimelate decarboxylase [Nitrospirota bacterium]
MNDFIYRGNELYCEEVSLADLAKKVGTPFYAYSAATLRNHFKAFDQAFAEVPHVICFAVKANSNLAVLNLFAKEGGGADIVSGGELFRALKAGVDPKKIVYAGVGKKREEIEAALKAGVMMFNIESVQEMEAINDVAGSLGVKAPVALRVNPDVDPKTHPYVSTGLKKSKFGVPIDRAVEFYKAATDLPHIEVVGIHKHIGSQLTEVGPFVDALEKIVALVKDLRDSGINIKYLDVGGGLGITYKEEEPPHPRDLAAAIIPLVKDLGCTLVFEPGRVLVGNAGALVTKTLYLKKGEEKSFVVVDAAMNDLARPSLYGSYHECRPVQKRNGGRFMADVVGPICESGDFLAKDRDMEEPAPGDILAFMSAGAYGFTMSSNYNSRPRVAEILISKDRYFVIKERETLDDLIRGEHIPDNY